MPRPLPAVIEQIAAETPFTGLAASGRLMLSKISQPTALSPIIGDIGAATVKRMLGL